MPRFTRLAIVALLLGQSIPTQTHAESPPAAASSPEAASPLRADVVVYGDASGGVATAVQAARMGKQVILVSQYGHLGGMTSSGLGWTDIGRSSILGGIAREFYQRVYQHYQSDTAWHIQARTDFRNFAQGVPAFDERTKLAAVFEPSVAEHVFDQLVKEAGVRVVRGRIHLERGVTKKGTRITSLVLEGGREVAARVFIDASYEGDLMAAAGVSYVTGRESNDQYQETANGITGPRAGNQLPDGIDPFAVSGDASSGLLPSVNRSLDGPIGAEDHRIQAYCYRMVLTDVASNRVPIRKPEGYRESEYEILFRAIEAGQKDAFFKADWMPNRKIDGNNASGISCDLIGGNYGPDWNWSTLSYAEREENAARHRDWQLGLVWTLQNHPRVPESIRQRMAGWGLAKDEFTDNNHWPYNLYIRELRRMVSDFVMTEHHCRGYTDVPDPIGMGAYTLDSHNVQRFVEMGHVKNEGDIQLRIAEPYAISYRAVTPRKAECDNLLVPWSLSASHIAFGSIRMEPVFMILGHSCGAAASIAVDNDLAVQDVPYDQLQTQLLSQGQRLEDERVDPANPEREAADQPR